MRSVQHWLLLARDALIHFTMHFRPAHAYCDSECVCEHGLFIILLSAPAVHGAAAPEGLTRPQVTLAHQKIYRIF